MAVSDSQYQRLLARLTALEQAHNDVVVAIDNFVTLQQLQELLTITTADLEDLRQQVTALENRVTSIEEEPLS
jgi:BMFP domain-containing protein YqiC